MARKIEKVEQPLNTNERYLYAIAVRLEVLIEQMGSLCEHIAKRDNVAVTSNEVKEETKAVAKPKRTTARKTTAKKVSE